MTRAVNLTIHNNESTMNNGTEPVSFRDYCKCANYAILSMSVYLRCESRALWSRVTDIPNALHILAVLAVYSMLGAFKLPVCFHSFEQKLAADGFF